MPVHALTTSCPAMPPTMAAIGERVASAPAASCSSAVRRAASSSCMTLLSESEAALSCSASARKACASASTAGCGSAPGGGATHGVARGWQGGVRRGLASQVGVVWHAGRGRRAAARLAELVEGAEAEVQQPCAAVAHLPAQVSEAVTVPVRVQTFRLSGF